MRKPIFISFILTSYNYSKYIRSAVDSILEQTYSNWELIVVDDGSADNSAEIIKSYCEKDNRIKLFTHNDNKNKGLCESIKLGISKASGEWIVFLESDDYITPDYLEQKIVIANKYKNVNLIFNSCKYFGNEDKVKKISKQLYDRERFLMSASFPKNMFYKFYIHNMIFTLSSVMVKRNDILLVDLNSPLDYLLDWWIYIQLAALGNFYFIPKKLTSWRQHYDSYINSAKQRTPYALQTKAYLKVFCKTKNFKILFFILFMHVLWFLKIITRKMFNFLRKLF